MALRQLASGAVSFCANQIKSYIDYEISSLLEMPKFDELLLVIRKYWHLS